MTQETDRVVGSQYSVVGKKEGQTTDYRLPATDNRSSPLLGVAEHFRPGEQQRVEKAAKALAALGLRHVRLAIPWADWREDRLRQWHQWLIGTLSRQFTILPALVYQPPVPSSPFPVTSQARTVNCQLSTSLPTTEPSAFADFLEEFVDSSPGTFEWIELPSEPASPGLWDWRLDPRGRNFSQILASAANRARQRGLKTVLGGLRAGDLGWLSLLCENGVVDFADAIGLQDESASRRVDPQNWPETLRVAQHILSEHCRNAPLWITAVGCSTEDYDEFTQCETLMRLLNTEAQRVYWSGLQDVDSSAGRLSRTALSGEKMVRDTHPRGNYRNWPGLLRADGSPKLLFRLWQSQGLEGVRQMVDSCQFSVPSFQSTANGQLSTGNSGNRPVLITGGAGFIGSNLAERLLQGQRPVMILDNLSRPGVEHNVRYLCDTYGDLVDVYIGDVRNRALVETLVARCGSIFHLAAQVAVTTSLTDPEGDFESNLRGTLNVLEAARKQDPMPPLLFTSTNKVYGDLRDIELVPVGKRHVPRDHDIRICGISEERPLAFHSPYGCSKGGADQYVLDYARMYGLPGVVFRMSCTYGRRQLGTEDQGWVAHFALQMLRDGVLTLFGDGRQVRDILYIDDLLEAMLLALKNIQTVAGKPFNIGGGPGNAVSLLEVIHQLAELSGVEPEVHYSPRRRGDQSYYISDTRRFHKATGWTPQVSVTRGVPRLYHWLLENVQPGVLKESVMVEG